MKKILSLALVFVLCFAMGVTAFAITDDSGFYSFLNSSETVKINPLGEAPVVTSTENAGSYTMEEYHYEDKLDENGDAVTDESGNAVQEKVTDRTWTEYAMAYKVTLAANDILAVRVDSTDVTVKMYNSGNTEISGESEDKTGYTLTHFTVAEAGTYNVIIWNETSKKENVPEARVITGLVTHTETVTVSEDTDITDDIITAETALKVNGDYTLTAAENVKIQSWYDTAVDGALNKIKVSTPQGKTLEVRTWLDKADAFNAWDITVTGNGTTAVVAAGEGIEVLGMAYLYNAGTINITAEENGVAANEKFMVTNNTKVTITAGKDGVNTSGSVTIQYNGEVAITGADDGIEANGKVTVENNSSDIATGGAVAITGGSDAVNAVLGVEATNANITLTATNADGIRTTGGSAEFTNCAVTVKAGAYGIYAAESVSGNDSVIGINSYKDGIATAKVVLANCETEIDTMANGIHSAESGADESFIPATVDVTGGKLDIAAIGRGIYCENGIVTVEKNDLDIAAVDDGINAYKVSVNKTNVTITTNGDNGDGIHSVRVSLTECKMAVDAYCCGIYLEGIVNVVEETDEEREEFVPGKLEIINCSGKIESDGDGIHSEDGNILIKNSKLSITAGDQGVSSTHDYMEKVLISVINNTLEVYSENDEGFYGETGTVLFVRDGSLTVDAENEAIDLGVLNMSDVWFDLNSREDIALEITEPLTLPGRFVMKSLDGHKFYTGSWINTLLLREYEGEYTAAYGMHYGSHIYSVEKPVACDHEFDENDVCTECGVKIINRVNGEAIIKPEEETNPNTGAGFACGAAALLGAVI